MKNQKGFVHVMALALLPFILGAVTGLFIFVGLIQMNSRLLGECRMEQMNTQKQVRKILLQLLAQNPKARRLKLSYDETLIAIAIAAAGNQGALPALYVQKRIIEIQRQALRIFQQALLAEAALKMNSAQWRIYNSTRKDGASQVVMLAPLLEVQFHSGLPMPTRLAVRPEYPDVAPPYRLEENFSDRQALVQKWQYHIRVRAPLSQFISGDANFEKRCSTTLKQEKENTWSITTKEDKS